MQQYFELFYIFFKIGLFSFGGGLVMLPLIFQEIQAFNIMPTQEFSNLVALSQMTPGPIAVNAATYVGDKYAGILGAIFATIGVSLPSFLIIIMIARFLNKFKENQMVQGVLLGIRPATIGLLGSAVIFLSETSIFNEGFYSFEMMENPLKYISVPSLFIFALILFLSYRFKIGPILLTVIGGIIGVIII